MQKRAPLRAPQKRIPDRQCALLRTVCLEGLPCFSIYRITTICPKFPQSGKLKNSYRRGMNPLDPKRNVLAADEPCGSTALSLPLTEIQQWHLPIPRQGGAPVRHPCHTAVADENRRSHLPVLKQMPVKAPDGPVTALCNSTANM